MTAPDTYEQPPAPSRSPWRHPGFRLLVSGQALSQVGYQLEALAVPVLAIQLLHASAQQMGYLNASATAAFLLVGLLAGGWVDRMRKRRVMMVADGVRAAAILVVPVLWVSGNLQIWHLYVVAGVVGVATVFFDVAYQSFIPILLPGEQVGRANGVLEGVAQVARLGGPGVAGALLAVVAAPLLLVADAVGFAASALCLLAIRDGEAPVPAAERRHLFAEIGEGIRFVASEPLLRLLLVAIGLSNLGATMVFTLLPLVVLSDLGATVVMLGIALSAGAVGGVLGSLVAARLAERFGEGPTLRWSALAAGVAMGLLGLGVHLPLWPAVAALVIAETGVSAAIVIFNMVQVTARQRLCPPRLLGRMNATIRFVIWGIMPLAALLAGFLGELFGARTAVVVGVTLTLAGAVPFLVSRYGARVELPREPEGPRGRTVSSE